MKSVRITKAALVCAGLIGADAGLTDAALDEPLSLSNRQPLVQIFNPPGARGGEVLAAGQSRWRLAYDVANNFSTSRRDDEAIVLDGETQRLELGAGIGLGGRWEVGVALPLIRHDGGGLDGFIEHWHSFWGLPDGDRPDYPRDRLRYRYSRDGRNALDFQHSTSGIGDLQVNAAYSLHRDERTAVALAATLSAPTGDADKLTGAGAAHLSLALAATRNDLFGSGLTATGNIGTLWLDRGEVLDDRQKRSVLFGSAGVSWAPGVHWRLKAQLDAHTAFYRSDLRELGAGSVQLLLGGSVRLGPRWLLDVAVSEDLAVDTAPDVALQLALRAFY